MQVAGGLDYLVTRREKLLRKNEIHHYPRRLAACSDYFAGTGNISWQRCRLLAEVARRGIKPCRPLSTAVVSAQIAIAPPRVSAAVVYMSSVMEGHGISYIHLLSWLSLYYAAGGAGDVLLVTCCSTKLSDDPICKRLEEGLIELRGEKRVKEIKPMAKISVWLFLLGVICVVVYAAIVNGRASARLRNR